MIAYEVDLTVRAGCPCGTRGNCCDDPQPGEMEHVCDETDDFCEGCYATECANCGRICYCEL